MKATIYNSLNMEIESYNDVCLITTKFDDCIIITEKFTITLPKTWKVEVAYNDSNID